MFNKKDYRLIFMGTPLLAAKVFESMILSGWNFVALIAQEDKPVGRKKEILPVPTKEVAIRYNIPVYQPHKIRLDFDFVKDLKPDCIVTLAYGQIVPVQVLKEPKFGCVNLHGSLLPKYRGAAPIQRAIMNGDLETGFTLMEMVEAMDAGRMYQKETIKILEDDNYSSILKKMEECAIKLIENALPKYLSGELKGENQNENEVTFANKILPEEEHLNLNDDINIIINKIRALSDIPGAYVYIDNQKFKIFKVSKYSSNVDQEIGAFKIESKKLLLQVNGGYLLLHEIQPEGKKRMSAFDFINGRKDIVGKIAK